MLLYPCNKTKVILQICHILLRSLVVKLSSPVNHFQNQTIQMHHFAHILLFSINHCIDDFKRYQQH